jgi:hypothetical protein
MPLYTICTSPTAKGNVGRQCGELKTVFHTLLAWDKECPHAFDSLKKVLCDAPVLALPDPKPKYCLHIDASQYVLDTVLSQEQGKAEKVMGYFR